MNRIKVIIAIAAVALFLSGCQYAPLPKEERYQFINEVKDSADISSAGEVISQSYDNGDGVLSPSWFKSEIRGAAAFETLKNRISSISGIRECTDSGRQLKCRKGGVDIFLSKANDSRSVELFINDSGSGR